MKTAEPISPAPAAPIRAGATRLLAAGSPARASPAAPARNNVPATAKFPVWIQPRDPGAGELGWQRAIAVPDRTIKEEHRDEDRARGRAAAQ